MRVITLDSNNKVISVKYVGSTCILEQDDIISDKGKIGQIQQADGSFITPTTPVPEVNPLTLEQLQDNQLIIMNAIADLYSALPDSAT